MRKEITYTNKKKKNETLPEGIFTNNFTLIKVYAIQQIKNIQQFSYKK
jgi:hypothetical protein